MAKNNHASAESHSHSSINGNKRILWSVLALSSSYLMAEIIGGIVSGSLALLADAAHMGLDVAATALGLFAFWFSQRPPSPARTFGYYRSEILAALLNAVTLVLVALWIFYEAIWRFSSPPEVHGGLMAGVAAGGLLVNVLSLYIMAKQSNDNLNMRGVWLHLITDTLGSLSALVAAFLVWKFNWNLADPIISIVIGALILFGAGKLLFECVDVLLVSVPKGIDIEEINRELETLPGVKGVHDLHIWAMNTGLNALSVHIELQDGIESAGLLRTMTRLLRKRYQITHTTIQIESVAFTHDGAHFCAPGRSFHVHPPKAHAS